MYWKLRRKLCNYNFLASTNQRHKFFHLLHANWFSYDFRYPFLIVSLWFIIRVPQKLSKTLNNIFTWDLYIWHFNLLHSLCLDQMNFQKSFILLFSVLLISVQWVARNSRTSMKVHFQKSFILPFFSLAYIGTMGGKTLQNINESKIYQILLNSKCASKIRQGY